MGTDTISPRIWGLRTQTELRAGSPGSPACRWESVGLRIMWACSYNKPTYLYLYYITLCISYLLYFSGEPWRIQMPILPKVINQPSVILLKALWHKKNFSLFIVYFFFNLTASPKIHLFDETKHQECKDIFKEEGKGAFIYQIVGLILKLWSLKRGGVLLSRETDWSMEIESPEMKSHDFWDLIYGRSITNWEKILTLILALK